MKRDEIMTTHEISEEYDADFLTGDEAWIAKNYVDLKRKIALQEAEKWMKINCYCKTELGLKVLRFIGDKKGICTYCHSKEIYRRHFE